MALKLSTGLRNFLLGEGNIRKAFEDGILNIYSGAAPANAHDAATGTVLSKITKASGAVAANARSSPQIGLITIGSHAPGETFIKQKRRKSTIDLGARPNITDGNEDIFM